MDARDQGAPGKDLNVKSSQEATHTDHGSIAGVSNDDRQNKRAETRNSSSHKPKVLFYLDFDVSLKFYIHITLTYIILIY